MRPFACCLTALIKSLRPARHKRGGPARIPNGRLVSGTQVNTGWSWHVEDVVFAETTIELCDGRPSDVEREGIVFRGGRFCPWAATIVRIDENYFAPWRERADDLADSHSRWLSCCGIEFQTLAVCADWRTPMSRLPRFASPVESAPGRLRCLPALFPKPRETRMDAGSQPLLISHSTKQRRQQASLVGTQ